jgi:hypothetical protein
VLAKFPALLSEAVMHFQEEGRALSARVCEFIFWNFSYSIF